MHQLIRYVVTGAAILAPMAIIAFPTSLASAEIEVGAKNNGLSAAEEVYLERYAEAQREFGSATVGANIVDDGMGKHEPYNLPDDLVEQKAETLGNMLRPPAPPPEPVETTGYESTETSYSEPTYAEPSYTGSSSCTPIPGEASSPSDVNPTSGAAGCYQVIPSTAAAMGAACDDVNAPSCLAAICAAQGNAAWSASGATPCG